MVLHCQLLPCFLFRVQWWIIQKQEAKHLQQRPQANFFASLSPQTWQLYSSLFLISQKDTQKPKADTEFIEFIYHQQLFFSGSTFPSPNFSLFTFPLDSATISEGSRMTIILSWVLPLQSATHLPSTSRNHSLDVWRKRLELNLFSVAKQYQPLEIKQIR